MLNNRLNKRQISFSYSCILKYFRSGRQQCEELSLTGNHCGNRRHRVANASEKTTTK